MVTKKQIHLYSVDTGDFNSHREQRLCDRRLTLDRELAALSARQKEAERLLLSAGYAKKDLFCLAKGRIADMNLHKGSYALLRNYHTLTHLKQYKNAMIQQTKTALLSLYSNKTAQNEASNGRDHIRRLNPGVQNETHIISLFESSLTRTLGIKEDELSTALVVVRIFYFDVFKDISYFGFTWNGEKYRYLTSSAGQIRQKKAVFIREALWDAYEKTILCGLTVSKINARGGNNVNKHLAYLALSGSATQEWTEFDIDKTIVIDDFTTLVTGTYDQIEDLDYSITRTRGAVPITHTDGAGMILYGKNRMIRLPWIKGLLGVFDFRKFILQAREARRDPSIGVISDIYGVRHDLIAENIEIIFTKSQFKMYRYYDSWDDYKHNYKLHHCQAGICNEEETRIPNASLNYQMNQTLTDVTDEELSRIAEKSIRNLNELCQTAAGMRRAFGVTPYNRHMSPLQEAIRIYPDLMNDSYLKITLRNIKDSLIKKYRAGKLETEGKYTYLLPDFYAACEYWFLGQTDPAGLLLDGEVYCKLFPRRQKLDCLRSPHLFKEHAVRRNLAAEPNEARKEAAAEWFCTSAVYTSCHDLISKILQFDVDGDMSLVVGDPVYTAVAERNMEGIVPLYYPMKKASPVRLNRKTIYQGLCAAFTGSNIGQFSNDIAKIWNSGIFTDGSKEERQKACDAVRLLCMENNFCIDYAKTLYKPKRPAAVNDFLTSYTRKKLPHFFLYAKDKSSEQVEAANGSTVNRLERLIPNVRLNTRAAGLSPIDYRLLMHDPAIRADPELIKTYRALNAKWHFQINRKDGEAENLRYLASAMRKEFAKSGYSETEIADMLVLHLYGNENPRKDTLWFCYGHILVENLKKNLKPTPVKCLQCPDCAEWFEVDARSTRTRRCPVCQKAYRLECQKKRMQKKRSSPSC